MRTFGKNDLKDFQFVKDDNIGKNTHSTSNKLNILLFRVLNLIIGKFYSAKAVDDHEKYLILILEAEGLQQALSILNEGFLYNGHKHKNLIKFYGGYLNQVQLMSNFCDDIPPEEKEDEKDNEMRLINLGSNLITY